MRRTPEDDIERPEATTACAWIGITPPKDRTYITGLEEHSIGCAKGEQDSSWIACVAGAMAALGEDFSCPYLMGVSGAAFRVQMHQPNWCPSAPCAVVGYDCVPGAMKATGYKLSWMPVQRASDKEQAKAQGLPTLQASIERGIAVICSSEEASLAVGFGQNGQRIIRQYVANGPGYVTTDDWPWHIGVIEPHELPMERRAVVAQSLPLAVTLAKTERFGQYHSGFAALRKWADDLEDDARFDALTQGNWFPIAHGNGYCYPCLWSARFNAERYLREVAEGYEDLAKSRLLDLAGLYQQMHQTLARTKPEFECIWSLQPWNLKSPASWTRAVRLSARACTSWAASACVAQLGRRRRRLVESAQGRIAQPPCCHAATRWYRWCSPPRIGAGISLVGPVIGASALGWGIGVSPSRPWCGWAGW